MKKKVYEIPSMKVVEIAMTSMICESLVTSIDGGDTGLGFGGGGDEDAQSRSFGGWGDE